MEFVSTRTACIRMAVLLTSVCALDALVAAFVPHPLHLCATIPGLIPLMTPAVLFTPAKLKRG